MTSSPSIGLDQDSANFTFMFEVVLEDEMAIFVLQLKPPGSLASPSRRPAADRQIRMCLSIFRELNLNEPTMQDSNVHICVVK